MDNIKKTVLYFQTIEYIGIGVLAFATFICVVGIIQQWKDKKNEDE